MTGRRRLLRSMLGAPLAGGLRSLSLRAAPATLFAGTASGLAAAPASAGSLADLIAGAKPSVVAVGVHAPLQTPRFRFLGTGFAVADGQKVVTAAHVVPKLDPAKRETLSIAVPNPAGDAARIFAVRAQALQNETDLALLAFEGPALPTLDIAPQDEVREGTEIVLLGFPIGSALGLFAAAHRGLVAAITPMVIPAASSAGIRAQNVQVLRGAPLQLLQLDATAYPGNSGGPLLDAATGKVVGVMSFGLAKGSRESALQSPTGICYAIPSRYVAALLKAA